MIVVAGSSGYLESHITRRLVKNGKVVRALVHNRLRAEHEGWLSGLGIEWIEGDETQPSTLLEAFHGASAMRNFHPSQTLGQFMGK
jgi:uncharacterized protein YbjT (DUF2867 family)